MCFQSEHVALLSRFQAERFTSSSDSWTQEEAMAPFPGVSGKGNAEPRGQLVPQEVQLLCPAKSSSSQPVSFEVCHGVTAKIRVFK